MLRKSLLHGGRLVHSSKKPKCAFSTSAFSPLLQKPTQQQPSKVKPMNSTTPNESEQSFEKLLRETWHTLQNKGTDDQCAEPGDTEAMKKSLLKLEGEVQNFAEFIEDDPLLPKRYNLIRDLVSEPKLENAVEIFKKEVSAIECEGDTPLLSSLLNTIMVRCRRAGEPNTALVLFRDYGIQHANNLRWPVFSSTILALLETDMIGEAIAVLALMDEYKVKPHLRLYTRLLNALTRFPQQIQESYIDTIATHMANHGMSDWWAIWKLEKRDPSVSRIKKLWKKMHPSFVEGGAKEAETQAISFAEVPTPQAVTDVIQTLLSADRIRDAIELYQFFGVKDTQALMQLLSHCDVQLRSAILSALGKIYQTSEISRLVAGLLCSMDVSRLPKMLKLLKHIDCKLDTRYISPLLDRIDPRVQHEIVHKFHNLGFLDTPNGLFASRLIDFYVDGDFVDYAVETATAASTASNYKVKLESYANLFFLLGDHPRGSVVLDLYADMKNKYSTFDEYTFHGAIRAMLHSNLIEPAVNVIEKDMIQHHVTPMQETRCDIVRVYVLAGQLSQAKQILTTIRHPEAVINTVLCGFLSIGDVDGALLLEEEYNRHFDSTSYILLADAYKAAGKEEETKTIIYALELRGWKYRDGTTTIRNQESAENEEEDLQESPADTFQVFRSSRETEKLPERFKSLQQQLQQANIFLNPSLSNSTDSILVAVASEVLANPSKFYQLTFEFELTKEMHDALCFISKTHKVTFAVCDALRYHYFTGGQCSTCSSQ